MRHTAAVYRRSIVAHLRSTMEYPADFWVMVSAGALWQVLAFAFLTVLFANIDSVAGWGYHEMLLLTGFLSLTRASGAVLWDGIWSTPTMIVKGELDYRIVRPAPVVVQVGSAHIGMQSFGEVSLGVAMLVYGWLGAGVGLPLLAPALLMAGCGIVINGALLTICCAMGFWVKGHFPVFAWIANDLQAEVMRFPLGIYPGLVRVLATFVLPFAFTGFVPAQILTGRAGAAWIVGTLVATAVTVAIAVGVFRLGLRRYDSSGH